MFSSPKISHSPTLHKNTQKSLITICYKFSNDCVLNCSRNRRFKELNFFFPLYIFIYFFFFFTKRFELLNHHGCFRVSSYRYLSWTWCVPLIYFQTWRSHININIQKEHTMNTHKTKSPNRGESTQSGSVTENIQ